MNRPVVLLADDEEEIRNLLTFVLEHENFTVLAASSGEGALLFAHLHGKIDILVADIEMGLGLSGEELAEELLKVQPGARVLLISAAFNDEEAPARTRFPFLPKPFLPSELIARVKALLQPEDHRGAQA